MSGLSDYTAKNLLNHITGQVPQPALPAVFLALFTTAPTADAGTGGTEVSGGAYARVQVAGAVAATASFTTGSPNITMTTNPGWVVPGMTVYDVTNGFAIGTVLTYVGTALILTSNAAHASSGSTDSLSFSAFSLSTGSAPSVITNTAVVAFAAASASWGTVVAFGLYDASTSGNLLAWDYLGNFAWLPATVSSASPGVVTAKAHGYSAADLVIYSAEYGGTAPSFSQSNFTGQLAVVSPATDTFTVTNAATAVNTSSTGSGSVRKIAAQSIPSGVTASFAASALNLQAA